MTYGIFDWAGNHLFPAESFETFEDAWDFILVNALVESEEDYGEYYALEISA